MLDGWTILALVGGFVLGVGVARLRRGRRIKNCPHTQKQTVMLNPGVYGPRPAQQWCPRCGATRTKTYYKWGDWERTKL